MITTIRSDLVFCISVVFVFISYKEREENVKADIFTAYITLLRQTRPVAGASLDKDSMEEDEGLVSTEDEFNSLDKSYLILNFRGFFNFVVSFILKLFSPVLTGSVPTG